MTEPEPDPYADDPFFKRVFEGHWNACIGRQGHEENYLDGYIEAAIELVDAIIDKKLFAKRDTLVLPILYNARHAIELALKFTTDRLLERGLLENIGIKRDHDIRTYWKRLHVAGVGDEKLRTVIDRLKPYVESVSRIDADGQELRYHRNRDNDPSLSEYSIANLKLIQHSLRELGGLLRDLKYRSVEFVDEWKAEACTTHCSRRDLFEIARMMPLRKDWSTQDFDDQKKMVKARFQLSNRQFSNTLNVIQGNREMAAIVGIESELRHLTDDDVIWVVEQWRRIHPVLDENESGGLGLDYFDASRFEGMMERSALYAQVIEAVKNRLPADALADLEAIYYVERDGILTEYYLRRVDQVREEHAAANDSEQEIRNLMEKTNLLQCLQRGAAKLGRLALAERLKAV